MKIRHNLSKGIAALAAVCALAACSHIDEDKRLIEVPAPMVSKNVLIEDYTGQLCSNCPNATETIHQLQQEYGSDRIIAVGIYSGKFGYNRQGKPLPLTTEVGNSYAVAWGVDGQPCGVIDRQGRNESYNTWRATVEERMQMQTPVSMDASLMVMSGKVVMTVHTACTENLSGTRIMAWLMEDSIVSPQVMPTGKTNSQYVHNHVFRCALSPVEGEAIDLTADESHRTNTYTLDADPAWVTKHLSAVAFVYDATGVLQAVSARTGDCCE